MRTPENIEDFKCIITDLIASTEDNDLNNALKIINTLISHDKEEVVASSLGNLYVLIRDKSIRELIINELNEMKCDKRMSIRKSAEESLDTISCELNRYEILDYSEEILDQIISKLDNYSSFKSHLPTNYSLFSKINSVIKSKIANSRFSVSWDNMMYNLMKIMLFIDKDLDIFQMNMVDVDDYYQNDLDKSFNLQYNELSQIEVPEEVHIDRLATVYTMTYKENGSISHLSGLLNDDDYKIRHMAIVGLCYALKGLSNFQSKAPDENLINKIFTEISPDTYENVTGVGFASK